MSVQVTKAVLKDFLTNAETNVLALTGAWGTGKTYAWREALLAHKNDIKFTYYCYISLFGINTMAELRMALFTKSVAVKTLDGNFDFDTVNKHWGSMAKDWMKGQLHRFGPLLSSLPNGSSISLGLEAIAPNTVRDTLVCFDDFERRTSIKPEDVLGLITELREERNCKVALIFNEKHLRDNDPKEYNIYRAYREKAIDFEVLYSPTVQEAFDLVFESSFPSREAVLRHVADLNITNVRILRKIRQVIARIADVTASLHADVLAATISSSVLLCWCAYAPDLSMPKLEEIEKWNKCLLSFAKEAEVDPATLEWTKRLKAYGFLHVDDLDLAIARVVERGYVEGTGFIEEAKKRDQELRSKEVSGRFESAWRHFHDTFSINQDSFIAELYDATVEAIPQIRVNDLNSTVGLLRDLARDDLADELINKFVAANQARPSIFDLTKHPFGGSVDDANLRAIFKAAYSKLETLPSLEEAVIFMAKSSSYNDEHLEAMKRASVDDFQAMFMKTHADVELSRLIKWSLRWAGTEHSAITVNAREALERIKATSLLNAVRVARFGA